MTVKRPLGDVIVRAYSGLPTFRSDDEGETEAIRMVNIKALSGFGVDKSKAYERPCKNTNAIAKYALKEGDVLVSVRGTVGKAGVVGSEAVGLFPSSNLVVIELGNQLLPEVLWAFLTSRKGQADVRSLTQKSVAQMAVTVQGLRSLLVPCPPIDKQKQIAAMIRAGVESYEKALQAAKLKKRIMLNAAVEVLFKEMK